MPSIAIDDRLLLLLFFWLFSSHQGVFLFGKQSQRLVCFSNDTIGSKSDGKRMEDREHQGGEKKSEKKGNRMLGSKTKKKNHLFTFLILRWIDGGRGESLYGSEAAAGGGVGAGAATGGAPSVVILMGERSERSSEEEGEKGGRRE